MRAWLDRFRQRSWPGVVSLIGKRIALSREEYFNGVLAGSPTTVVTCWHVLLSSETLMVEVPGQGNVQFTHVIAEDPLADVVVLRCAKPIAHSRCAPLLHNRLSQHAAVHAVAVEQSGIRLARPFTIDYYCDLGPTPYCQLLGTAAPGMSGAGVFASSGELVGMVCTGWGTIVRCLPADCIGRAVASPEHPIAVGEWRKNLFGGQREKYVLAMRTLRAASERREDRHKCLMLLDKASEVDPTHDYVVASLDLTLSQLQLEEPEILEFLQRWTRAHGHTWLSAFFVGASQVRLGLHREAASSFELSESLKRSAPASYWKAVALKSAKDEEGALLAATEGLRRHPDCDDLRQLLVSLKKQV